jgi:hypothetical protein
MADTSWVVQRIRANAQIVISVAGRQVDEEIGYDEAGIDVGQFVPSNVDVNPQT